MRTLGLVAMVALVASVMAVGGCKETYNMTFTNVSGQAMDVAVSSPEGTDDLASISDGRSRSYTLKLDDSDLPARCQVQAGNMVKDFSLDKQMKKELFFYIEERTIVGPLDKNTKINKTSKVNLKAVKTEQKELITGEKPVGEAPKDNASNGGEKIINQGPVIE